MDNEYEKNINQEIENEIQDEANNSLDPNPTE